MAATRRLEMIARTQLTGAAASVSFANVPTDFRKFFLVCFIVNDANAKSVNIRFNNDSAANYTFQLLRANGAVVDSARAAAQADINPNSTSQIAASSVAMFVIEISKPVAAEVARATIRGALDYTGNGITFQATAAEWTNTAALISRIDVVAASNNFAAGTRILLAGSRD